MKVEKQVFNQVREKILDKHGMIMIR